jgi:hypothetical protein
MKLYATTKSERASKGQGGEWLEITVTDKDRNILFAYTNKDGIQAIGYKDGGAWVVDELTNEKGEKQTGETCQTCGGGGWLPDDERCLNCNPYKNREKACLYCKSITKTSLDNWHCVNCGIDN